MTATTPIPQDIDHIGVIVRSIDDAKRFLGETLGLPLVKETHIPEKTRAAFFRCGGCEIEVIEVLPEDVRQRRLGDNAARIEHIAVRVENLDDVLTHLAGQGGEMDAPPLLHDGDRMSFSVPASTMGVRFQFIQKNFEK
ncbi:VOC family protein [Nocardioides humi]|uniref:VOC family protein n=1 Tax=Nocardioides humi TaxID=449461 RepID=UPI002482286B|nr:VOC family protein [Nocardioides humi]